MDRFRALEVFRSAVDLGSFAAASRHLGLSPAAVSKNVGELEADLGVRLLQRTTRRMSLTEAGSTYYATVVRVLDELNEAREVVGEVRGSPKGRLRVSAPMTVTLVCFSAAIPRFLEQYPELTLDLRLDDRRVNIVEEGFDLAIRGTSRLEDSSLIARKLMTIPHVVCGAPTYFERAGTPTTPEDLLDHECIKFSLSGQAHVWTFRNGASVVQQRVNGRYEVSSSLAVRDALYEGHGLSLIPLAYVRADLRSGRLRAVLRDWTADESTLYAVYPSARFVAPKVRAFIGFLVDELGDAGGS